MAAADYTVSIQSLGDDFESMRRIASSFAADVGSLFWWDRESDWEHFIFKSFDAANAFHLTVLLNPPPGEKTVTFLHVSPDEVHLFAEHCVHIWSVFDYARRLFSDCSDAERMAMGSVAPRFFVDLDQVFADYVITAACRVTDPRVDIFGNENLAVDLFPHAFWRYKPLVEQLTKLQARMKKHRTAIEAARNKLTAHSDRKTIRAGQPLAAATWTEWLQFWVDLREFVTLIYQHVFDEPFDIKAAGVRGDAEMLLRKLQL
ncbi:hypothetical protein [Bradyrhizobium elkanii]|uniref:AbiU2 domain-containing protein n=1 Tax=Bradyrhizobium elkanii TaxID=29448 RepID=UPI00216A0280|nr:hypothetical protein [Bradyrhizobium elkanii]MCS3521843.1 hypothetical protein [Bradyrhizobium elkanii]MCS4069498.1 hypothetical protein [Bradyrhizobium elkanii]MCS4076128.1 hypothetical protein [Bradyrhizobium elkanii]MDH6687732.1 hypothetical protein [Bradyrhizobium elkanii]